MQNAVSQTPQRADCAFTAQIDEARHVPCRVQVQYLSLSVCESSVRIKPAGPHQIDEFRSVPLMQNAGILWICSGRGIAMLQRGPHGCGDGRWSILLLGIQKARHCVCLSKAFKGCHSNERYADRVPCAASFMAAADRGGVCPTRRSRHVYRDNSRK